MTARLHRIHNGPPVSASTELERIARQLDDIERKIKPLNPDLIKTMVEAKVEAVIQAALRPILGEIALIERQQQQATLNAASDLGDYDLNAIINGSAPRKAAQSTGSGEFAGYDMNAAMEVK
jgi:hypothetical protein